MWRNVQILFRPNHNAEIREITDLATLTNLVRVNAITLLAVEGPQEFNLVCVPGRSQILHPAGNNQPLIDLDSLKHLISSWQQVSSVVFYPLESTVCSLFGNGELRKQENTVVNLYWGLSSWPSVLCCSPFMRKLKQI